MYNRNQFYELHKLWWFDNKIQIKKKYEMNETVNKNQVSKNEQTQTALKPKLKN